MSKTSTWKNSNNKKNKNKKRKEEENNKTLWPWTCGGLRPAKPDWHTCAVEQGLHSILLW
jgi:hypothetical protein